MGCFQRGYLPLGTRETEIDPHQHTVDNVSYEKVDIQLNQKTVNTTRGYEITDQRILADSSAAVSSAREMPSVASMLSSVPEADSEKTGLPPGRRLT